MSSDLFNWRDYIETDQPVIAPWKPRVLRHDQWPPNYIAVYAWRMRALSRLQNDEAMLASAKEYYADKPSEFIMHWMDTYDPRVSNGEKWMPFVFFTRQFDYLEFLNQCIRDGENGLVEKCRDAGATWLSCGSSVHSLLFRPNFAVGWGSRKEELVDNLGNPDSIFEKMRLLLRRLPSIFKPATFDIKKHAPFRRIINPDNGSVIMGEAGDNIGRGGRTSLYFKDESAHYERPELIEAALGDNTNVQIDISSVNGIGNVFYRRRQAGKIWHPGAEIEKGFTRVFIIDWKDHPAKSQSWYDTRRARYEREGMLHVFKQEVDRDYAGAVSNVIIAAEWVEASVNAHLSIPVLKDVPNTWAAGLDVADEGIDRNALGTRQGVIVRSVEEWGERDAGVTTRRAIEPLRIHKGIKIQYDSIGIGAAVKAEYNRLVDANIVRPDQLRLVPWNAGSAVLWPYERIIPNDEDSITNRDFFGNLKAQAWWSLRTRFYKTFQCIMAIKAGDPVPNYSADELISLDGSMPLLAQLKAELSQPTRGSNGQLKMIINKKPDGMKSPNLADAVVMMFYPIPDDYGAIIVGNIA